MSYDIAVWVGEKPADEAAADAAYAQVLDGLESRSDEPPASEIEHFASLLIKRWPELGQAGDETSPWTASPILADAAGSALLLGLKTDSLDVTLPFIAEAADRLGLVAYDPQQDGLLLT